MKNFSLILSILYIIIFSTSSISVAQKIEGDVLLSSQAEVNAFTGTSIDGSLIISGFDITDLSPLQSVTSLGGNLSILENFALTSLQGLNNVSSIGNFLQIEYNPLISNLDGLNNVLSIGITKQLLIKQESLSIIMIY